MRDSKILDLTSKHLSYDAMDTDQPQAMANITTKTALQLLIVISLMRIKVLIEMHSKYNRQF